MDSNHKQQRGGGWMQGGNKRPRVEAAGFEPEGGAVGAVAAPDNGRVKATTARSEKFDAYYRAQAIVPPEEYETFANSLLQPLPVTFRVNPLDPGAPLILARLCGPLQTDNLLLEDGTVVPPPVRLPWYPSGLAWQVAMGRTELRKAPAGGALKQMHEWLTALNNAGGISRQETVSMIPPLLLDVQPTHVVLDMCASPGSKTAQLLEALHSQELPPSVRRQLAAFQTVSTAAASFTSTAGAGAGGGDDEFGPPPSGFVVANDNDSKRAFMLTHQTNRLSSTAVLVSCHDGQEFPGLGMPRRQRAQLRARCAAASATGLCGWQDDPRSGALLFDRILCDVPCTGDGTARKNADVLPRWGPVTANSLHGTQVIIGMRGLQLLAPGGLMAYSTCSFNPVENEAVVAELLRRCGGAVEVVDCGDRLEGLRRAPGRTVWTVHDGAMTPYESWASVLAAQRCGQAGAANDAPVPVAAAVATAVETPAAGGAAAAPSWRHMRKTQKHPESRSKNWKPRPVVPASAVGIAAPAAGDAKPSPSARLLPTLFPPGRPVTEAEGSATAAAHAAVNAAVATAITAQLPRCMRLLPHLQDTGGFFVALLRKIRRLPASASTAKPSATNWQATGASAWSDEAAPASTAVEGPSSSSAAVAEDKAEGAGSAVEAGLVSADDDVALAAAEEAEAQAASGGGAVKRGREAEDEDDGGEAGSADEVGEEGAEEGEGSAAPVGGFSSWGPATGSSLTAYYPLNAAVGGPLLTFYGIRTTEGGGLGWSGGCTAAAGAVAAADGSTADTAAATAASTRTAAGAAIPGSHLCFRGNNGRSIVVVNGTVANRVLPLAKRPDNSGTLRVVSTGWRVFEAASASFQTVFGASALVSAAAHAGEAAVVPGAAAAAASEDTAVPAAKEAQQHIKGVMAGHGVQTPYRLCQEGLAFLLPYVTRQVVYASGAECLHLLRTRGRQEGLGSLPPRLRWALQHAVAEGSVAVVCAPALDGCEQAALGGSEGAVLAAGAYPLQTPQSAAQAAPTEAEAKAGGGGGVVLADSSAAAFLRVMTVDAAAMTVAARCTIAEADAVAVPPALRGHYRRVTRGGAAALLEFAPDSGRLFRSTTPLSAVAMTLWCSRGRAGLMVSEDDSAAMAAALRAAGYV